MGGCADAGPINEVRQQQLAALSLPNVGMASAIDIADDGSPLGGIRTHRPHTILLSVNHDP